tara:strand:- start:3573 stop:3737 length:165 start_codon:yes stop_codon:yes gene_type:complete
VTLKDLQGPKKDWNNNQWLKHSQIMFHSPWISEEEREYWKDKINDLNTKKDAFL